jgi:hypothetical protein
MKRRQTSIPRRWLIADNRNREDLRAALRKLSRGSGVLVVIHDIAPQERQKLLRRLRQAGRTKRLTIVDEAAGAARRVHNIRELRDALLARTDDSAFAATFDCEPSGVGTRAADALGRAGAPRRTPADRARGNECATFQPNPTAGVSSLGRNWRV